MPKTPQRWIAVLGRRDEPTDALEDYCRRLASALEETLEEKRCSLELFRIAWAEQGWPRALRDLDKAVVDRKASWALVQYTALSWSSRGFPNRFVGLIRRLKRAGMNVAIVFHDPFPFAGFRLRDRLRRRVQLAVMSRSARLADRIITTISPDCVPWMQTDSIARKATLVPVGSNLCAPPPYDKSSLQQPPVVAVFGVTERQREEALLIATVVSHAAEQAVPLRLVVFGRGAKLAEQTLSESLRGSPVQLAVFDVLNSAEAGALLANSDVQLFVRSGLASNRGSAIAGIVCGLPIVGFAGPETSFPITEAGVRLVPLGNAEELTRELLAVLQDEKLHESLCQRSREAAGRHFSWKRIAERYLAALG